MERDEVIEYKEREESDDEYDEVKRIRNIIKFILEFIMLNLKQLINYSFFMTRIALK